MTTTTIKTRPAPDVPYSKIGTNSKYAPVELTEQWVFDHSSFMSMTEMARMFQITPETLAGRYNGAFHAGRVQNKMKHRMILQDLIASLKPTATYDHRIKDAKTNELLKALDLWARWYDGIYAKEEVKPEASPLSKMSAEELDAAILAVAASKGWAPPK